VLLDVTKPAPSQKPARWLQERIVDFAQSVLSIVPAGFDRYARLFHPAGVGPDERPVSWADVATSNGRVPHRQMQWGNITGGLRFMQNDTQPGLWDYPPEQGSLPLAIASALVDVLIRHTTTPDLCWFAVWEGFGGLPVELTRTVAFELPARRYHLLAGPASAILESVPPEPSQQTANIWWPEDRAWCVTTEIDLMTTYLAVDADCLSELESTPGLEVLAAQPTDAITWAGDLINKLNRSDPSGS
jgi:hypothetical protein